MVLSEQAGRWHVDVKVVSKQVGDRQARFKNRKAVSRRRHDDSLVPGSRWPPKCKPIDETPPVKHWPPLSNRR